jgi:lipoate---protein ligase
LKDKMLLVENPSRDPWFNIAVEEYLLKHFEPGIVMIWSSNPSVIVGKHQNALGEINFDFVRQNNIPVIRRLSGGGTVFHDPGNINFTFIKETDKARMIDYQTHLEPVISFLHTLNLPAGPGGKNDIRVNGLKISGNAEHIYKNKVLHHGTLLFDADLTHLTHAIKAAEENFESKAVKSIRSTVVNISSLLDYNLAREDFTEMLKKYLSAYYNITDVYQFDQSDIRAIEKLSEEKYKTWEWNFGYSPSYTFRNHGSVHNVPISVELRVARGKIENAELKVNGDSADSFAKAIVNEPHNPDRMRKLLQQQNFHHFNDLPDPWEMLRLFF